MTQALEQTVAEILFKAKYQPTPLPCGVGLCVVITLVLQPNDLSSNPSGVFQTQEEKGKIDILVGKTSKYIYHQSKKLGHKGKYVIIARCN